jgi:hypothetical protein
LDEVLGTFLSLFVLPFWEAESEDAEVGILVQSTIVTVINQVKKGMASTVFGQV